MKTYDEACRDATEAAVKRGIETLFASPEYDARHLDCLTNPKKCAPVIRLGKCDCGDEKPCQGICFYDALSRGEDGNVVVSQKDCVGCGDCIAACESHNLAEIREVVPIFERIDRGDAVYAMIAPAAVGQFGEDATPGRLRSAFKRLGFTGMIEVALFADILTLKEALEFDAAVQTNEDFVLTSCCCPIWVGMIQKVYNQLLPHMPPSVSPMAACGRAVKALYPGAVTVFIGPCLAKKAEARATDISDGVDFVLTFKETEEIFRAAGIDTASLDEDLRDHSSAAGRMYGRTGGVSESVEATVRRLKPERAIPVRARQADGIPACKALLADIQNGNFDANFLEGMGCNRGCVGGPRALINRDKGAEYVDGYAKKAAYETPADNPYVLELLRRLGFDTIESLVIGANMFTRRFE
jgi:iron only hydrogenase large subunit-like protein